MDKMKRISPESLDALEAAVMRDETMSDNEAQVLEAIQELRLTQRIAVAAQAMIEDGGHSKARDFAEIVYNLNRELKTYFELEQK